ncbi:MAG: hypothetical protein KDK12_20500, partial [Rhodobacteraceae bacterium]|nr:hypothetical protein [Paracoccaceae bacterium]
GRARNLGQRAAEGAQVLFLDADDTVRPELGDLAEHLSALSFDMVHFAHDVDHRLASGARGPEETLDREIWAALALSDAPTLLDAGTRRALSRVSAYPWNKIWSRAFLERAAVQATEIPVHNDIEPHWTGYLRAGRLMASALPGVVHSVAPAGARLSNRRGAERQCVFAALDAVVDQARRAQAEGSTGRGAVPAFLEFALRLLDWIDAITDQPSDRLRLARARRAWLERVAAALGPQLVAALSTEPGFAARLLAALDENAGGGLG